VGSLPSDGLAIRPGLVVPWAEIRTEPLRGGGPGGQNVNKVSSGVLLRFDVAGSAALSALDKQRIGERLSSRLTNDGVLILKALEHREHARNLDAAFERLAKLLAAALERPATRHRTRPTRSSQRRRLDAKRRSGERKATRRRPPDSDS
jgi:ribosome-associated protein